MNCEIICVGTELLLGDILNTNAQYLARELAALGIGVHHQQVVGDNPQRMRESMLRALKESDMIILSGGLGPTADDLTKEICCEVMGERLVLDEDILEGIRSYFVSRGRQMADNNKKQAYVPENGIVFPNRNGTAPGCGIEKDGKIAIMLPGPPRELEPMFQKEVMPYLAKKTGGIILSKQVRTFGIGESNMAAAVEDLLDGENPTVAPYAKDGEALLRVTARAESEEKASAMCDETIEKIRERIAEYIYGIDVSSLEEKAVELLKAHGKKLALAESCTGGYIAKRITDIAGSSAVFEYGVVSYSNEVKINLLGVKPETIEKYTEVSEQTAAEMAEGVRRLSGADFALSVTGISGPGGGSEDKPVGLAYIGFAHEGGTTVKELRTGKKENSRDYNRYVTASTALHMLVEYLNGRDGEYD
ncbi:MAG: competence/damage-inducible protein A [Clostridia bacterium]|nr:competence/damage-inducible protein A [Clostridia bacterium]